MESLDRRRSIQMVSKFIALDFPEQTPSFGHGRYVDSRAETGPARVRKPHSTFSTSAPRRPSAPHRPVGHRPHALRLSQTPHTEATARDQSAWASRWRATPAAVSDARTPHLALSAPRHRQWHNSHLPSQRPKPRNSLVEKALTVAVAAIVVDYPGPVADRHIQGFKPYLPPSQLLFLVTG